MAAEQQSWTALLDSRDSYSNDSMHWASIWCCLSIGKGALLTSLCLCMKCTCFQFYDVENQPILSFWRCSQTDAHWHYSNQYWSVFLLLCGICSCCSWAHALTFDGLRVAKQPNHLNEHRTCCHPLLKPKTSGILSGYYFNFFFKWKPFYVSRSY